MCIEFRNKKYDIKTFFAGKIGDNQNDDDVWIFLKLIDEKMVEGAFKLPNELPKTSKKYIINSDELLNADYKIERVKRLK